MDADPVGGPDGRDGFDDFLQKAVTILDAPAVLIGAMVRLRLEESVDQVAVGGVESSSASLNGRTSIFRFCLARPA
jgi:hypothetical protein